MTSTSEDYIARVLQRRREELLRIPGVTGAAVGRKIKNGEEGDLGITVFVARKKRPADLAAEERVPISLDGVSTDVVEGQFEIEKL